MCLEILIYCLFIIQVCEPRNIVKVIKHKLIMLYKVDSKQWKSIKAVGVRVGRAEFKFCCDPGEAS